jgi:hypothetical protein
MKPEARAVYSKAFQEALSSAGPALRADTKKRLQVANEAGEAAVMQQNLLQVKADKAKAEADQAKANTKYQAKATNAYQATATNVNQAKANKQQGTLRSNAVVELVTKTQTFEALKIWKDLLISTHDYLPLVQRTEEEELKEVKVLKSAMNHFRLLRLSGMEKLRTSHNEFQYLQEKYHIPRDFCMPADFFREEQLDPEVAYYKRCCSIYDFYNMLSKDSPGYVHKGQRRANKELQSPVAQGSAKPRVNPAYNPFAQPQRQDVQPQRQNTQPQRQDVIQFRSTNPSDLDREAGISRKGRSSKACSSKERTNSRERG